MRYTRTFSNSISGQTVRVVDTANNLSVLSKTVAIGIDSQAPVVTLTESGSATNKTVIINATDTVSKIWKTNSAAMGSTNFQGIIYKKVPKVNIDTAMYDEDCNVSSPLYATISDTTASGTAQVTVTGLNLNNDVLAYCVEDNA